MYPEQRDGKEICLPSRKPQSFVISVAPAEAGQNVGANGDRKEVGTDEECAELDDDEPEDTLTFLSSLFTGLDASKGLSLRGRLFPTPFTSLEVLVDDDTPSEDFIGLSLEGIRDDVVEVEEVER